MAKTPQQRMMPPARTPEERENQLIAMAVECAEKQLRNGTASTAIVTHYLKLGSTRERLEQERLLKENELLRAKTEQLGSQKKVEELMAEALTAIKSYQGIEDDDMEM